MRLFAESVFEHLKRQVDDRLEKGGEGNKLLFMLPSMPAPVVLELSELLSEYALDRSMAKPLLKIARELSDEWLALNDTSTEESRNALSDKGCFDDRGSLTSYRNINIEDNGLMMVVLVGVDKVTDSSSLADFYHCGLDVIWEEEMGNSFEKWVRRRLDESSIGYEKETVARFDEVLKSLVIRGLTDIVQLSGLLERLDLSSAQDGRDAEAVLLSSLEMFGLPRFREYPGGRRSFSTYLEEAMSIFSYHAFIEETARKKALKKIDGFEANNEVDEVCGGEAVGTYSNGTEMLSGLRSFVNTGDVEERQRLLGCNYIETISRVLNYKAPKVTTVVEKETVKKLSGGPVEVVLTALWHALRGFKEEATRDGLVAHEALTGILIESTLFKHDSEGDTSYELKDKAVTYLKRLVGGVDSYIQDSVDPARLSAGPRNVEIKSRFFNTDMAVQAVSRGSEPSLEFAVSITGEGLSGPVVRRYAWRLPETEPYRIADGLVLWAAEEVKKTSGFCLPVFNVPFYEELMLAKDYEEVRRILLHSIKDEDKSSFNLLATTGVDTKDPLHKHLQKLAYEFDAFMKVAASEGLHLALRENWNSLRKSYEAASDSYLSIEDCARSPLAAFLFRAFLITGKHHDTGSDSWAWLGYEPSCVVTVLHPALLEMLQAHIMYLFTCFNFAAGKELKAPGTRSFREVEWFNYVELASIQTPLLGLITNRNKILSTDVRGEGLVHRIGLAGGKEASLTTRLLLRYEAFEDEEITDTELFRESRESKLLNRIITDYYKLHPHARDGLRIALFSNRDIQPVIAAVDQYLRSTVQYVGRLEDGLSSMNLGMDEINKYTMSIVLFTESSDDTSVTRWIGQWKERWQEAEAQASLSHYRNCSLSISHRIISSDESYSQFRKIIETSLDADIFFLDAFIGAGAEGNEFEQVDHYDVTTRTLKFPVLEKSFCSFDDPRYRLQRARLLSNRQFRVSTRHAELMARLKDKHTPQNTYHVILGIGDYTPWQKAVDDLHQKVGWVVCVDPNIDERLIAMKAGDSKETREIIGFGSGVGSHGEANYTISTEQFKLTDIMHLIAASIGQIFEDWSGGDQEEVAKAILKESRRLSGLSLVRATGIGTHIRDFMAYALVRKMLQAPEGCLCDHLISLDAYQHWFESSSTDTRPDLLWLQASVGNDNRMHLDMRLIECKMAKASDAHLVKARQQLENGLFHLSNIFMPRDDSLHSEDDRPEERYWWLQLHRMISSKAEIAERNRSKVLSALERLSEGDYDIEWHAAAVTFWSDQKRSTIEKTDGWKLELGRREIEIDVITTGSEFIKGLCASESAVSMPWGGSSIIQKAVLEATKPDDEEGVDQEPEEIEEPEEEPVEVSQHAPESETVSIKPEPTFVTTAATSVRARVAEVPKRVLLGKTVEGSREVFWEFGHKELNNRHMLIFGASGVGKTYTIQCLLQELARSGQNSLIIDYTNGFHDNQLEVEFIESVKPKQHIVKKQPLPINPLRRQLEMGYGSEEPELEKPVNTAQRVSGVFSEVYNFGDQQKSALYKAIKQGIETSGGEGITFDDIIKLLEEVASDRGVASNPASTVISRIQPFIDQNPFGAEEAESWKNMFTDEAHNCHILQLAGFIKDTARLITEFSLLDLYWFYRNQGTEETPHVLVLDEVQNLDHREDSPLAQFLTEGRKFGFSLILATQIMSNLGKDEKDRLFNAAHKLFFKPADTEIKTYAEIASNLTKDKADIWNNRLITLKRGECYSLGPSLNEATGALEQKAFKIRIAPLGERMGND